MKISHILVVCLSLFGLSAGAVNTKPEQTPIGTAQHDNDKAGHECERCDGTCGCKKDCQCDQGCDCQNCCHQN